MTKEEHIKYWLDGADHDLKAAESLYASEKYDWCLFLAHLVLEKTLKAYFVLKNDKVPPKTHNLIKLAEQSFIKLTTEKQVFFDEVNDFNLEARYPDYKNDFYNGCTKDFTDKYLTKIMENYNWLKSLIESEE
jgi:HEPN domain-containing protein